ncbi:MAG: ImmA/IrrE family metallo-endopeptidase [Thermoleophilia bacterium]
MSKTKGQQSTVARGDALEVRIAELLEGEIEAGRFWAKAECCRVLRKQPYHSAARGSDIVFDIAVEISLPGEEEPSLVVLVECKNYSHLVPVDDVEEFYQKIDQVTGANVKGILATRTALQSGALAFAKSKKLAVLRYFDGDQFKWELRRSASTISTSKEIDSRERIESAITQASFRSHFYDLYCLTPEIATNSLRKIIGDVVSRSGLQQQEVARLQNRESRGSSIVPFLPTDYIEDRARETLERTGYQSGPTSLKRVVELENRRSGLELVEHPAGGREAFSEEVLGAISFDPLRIELFVRNQSPVRWRFTLAHELSHHILKHGEYMRREFCQESDFGLDGDTWTQASEVGRLEWQANYLAGCLLLPQEAFLSAFATVAGELGIVDKGFGALFVDSQPCNVQNLHVTLRRLAGLFDVSRAVVGIRLEGLGILKYGSRPIKLGDLLGDLWV